MIQNIKIIQWNCRGIRSKINELKYFLSVTKPHIVCLNETNLHDFDDYRLSIPDFLTIEPSRREDGRGVAILIQKNLVFSPIFIDNHFRNSPIEVVGVKLSISDLDLSIFTLYISPSFNVSQSQLNRVTTLISNCNSQILINGDFNAHNILWGSQNSNLRGDFLVNATDFHNLILLDCNKPTYFGPNSQSTLDLTFTSPQLTSSCSWDTYNDLLQSDHCPTITTISLGRNLDRTFVPPIFPKEVDPESFTRKFEKKVSPYNENISSNDNYKSFFNSLVFAASFTPKNSKKNIATPCPWWNLNCSKAVAQRRLAFTKLKRNCSRENFDNWKRVCSKTKEILAENKQLGWKNFCSSLAGYKNKRSLEKY